MKPPDTPIQLIVGLGNPGTEYEHTRHNAGQDFVSRLMQSAGEQLTNSPKFYGLTGKVTLNNREIRTLVPTTYMNLSGQAIAAIVNFYKIPHEQILVVHDELDLDPGVARLKLGGGHGGHNGLRDTVEKLGNSHNFARLRIGIGHPGSARKVVGYVLQRADQAEQDKIDAAFSAALTVIPDVCSGDWSKAMRELHTKIE